METFRYLGTILFRHFDLLLLKNGCSRWLTATLCRHAATEELISLPLSTAHTGLCDGPRMARLTPGSAADPG